jgi:hypothetical protein
VFPEILGNLIATTSGGRWMKILKASEEAPENFYMDNTSVFMLFKKKVLVIGPRILSNPPTSRPRENNF